MLPFISIIKQVFFDTKSYSFIPGANPINTKWALITLDPNNPKLQFINLFTTNPIVKAHGKIIDMEAHKISDINIIGANKAQYFMQKGYKYNGIEYPNAILQKSPDDLGQQFLDRHYSAIEQIMLKNYDTSGNLDISKYAEIIIKLIDKGPNF